MVFIVEVTENKMQVSGSKSPEENVGVVKWSIMPSDASGNFLHLSWANSLTLKSSTKKNVFVCMCANIYKFQVI